MLAGEKTGPARFSRKGCPQPLPQEVPGKAEAGPRSKAAGTPEIPSWAESGSKAPGVGLGSFSVFMYCHFVLTMRSVVFPVDGGELFPECWAGPWDCPLSALARLLLTEACHVSVS